MTEKLKSNLFVGPVNIFPIFYTAHHWNYCAIESIQMIINFQTGNVATQTRTQTYTHMGPHKISLVVLCWIYTHLSI